LNKWSKNSVDEAIYQQSPEEVQHVDFCGMEDIQIFNTRAENFIGNPFITKNVFVHLSEEEEIQMFVDILRRFGHELWSLHLVFELQDPFRFWHQFSQALNRIPNIRRLSIEFPLIEEDDESWAEFVAQPDAFPRLENMTELTVDPTEEFGHSRISVPAPSVRPLLLAYQDQLTELSLESFVFGGDP